MTFQESASTYNWQPSQRGLLVLPALLFAGVLSAILTVANPPVGVANISAGLGISDFSRPGISGCSHTPSELGSIKVLYDEQEGEIGDESEEIE